MNVPGYDAWRLTSPWDEHDDLMFDDEEMREAALDLAEDVITDDEVIVEEILMEDETWQTEAFDCAMGRIDQNTLRVVILDLITAYLLEHHKSDVEGHAYHLRRDRDEY